MTGRSSPGFRCSGGSRRGAWGRRPRRSPRLPASTGPIRRSRNPVNLALEAAALDVLSEGRLILGVGAGWMREEFATLGIDPAERGARTDEYIQVLRTLWTNDPANFNGRFVDFDGVVLATKPATEGGPRIWVGGNNDAGLRRALRHGDGWHG